MFLENENNTKKACSQSMGDTLWLSSLKISKVPIEQQLCFKGSMKVLNFSDSKLDEILTRLIPEFQPTKMFLFGSRANGTSKDNSDYDVFLVVRESELHPIERMQKAGKLLWGVGVTVDVFIYTEEEFNDWKEEFNSIPHTVATEGMELRVG